MLICGCSVKNDQEAADQHETNAETQKTLSITDLQLVDLNGNEVSESYLLEKPVFVHFWATWCRPCIKEMPGLQKTINKLKTEGIEVHFLFPSNESLSKIKKFKQGNEYTFDYYQLTSGFEQIGIHVLPTTLLFNKEGELVDTIIGAQEWDNEGALQDLRNLAN